MALTFKPSTPEEVAIYKEYVSLLHAMQTGVKMMMNIDPKQTDLKHLRVGINSAMVEHSALVFLLVNKGLINRLEYFTYLRDFMQNEVDSYRDALVKKGLDPRIDLG